MADVFLTGRFIKALFRKLCIKYDLVKVIGITLMASTSAADDSTSPFSFSLVAVVFSAGCEGFSQSFNLSKAPSRTHWLEKKTMNLI